MGAVEILGKRGRESERQRYSACQSQCRDVLHAAFEHFWNLLQDQLLEGPTLIQAGRDAA